MDNNAKLVPRVVDAIDTASVTRVTRVLQDFL